MATVIEGVSRRKLYEYMSALESFLLELEQYIRHKSDKNLNEVINVDQFKKSLIDIFQKCVIVINFFIENKILNSSQDFLKDVLSNQEKLNENSKLYINNIKDLESIFTQKEKEHIIKTLDMCNSNWEQSIDSINEIFKDIDEFHSIIMEILQYERK